MGAAGVLPTVLQAPLYCLGHRADLFPSESRREKGIFPSMRNGCFFLEKGARELCTSLGAALAKFEAAGAGFGMSQCSAQGSRGPSPPSFPDVVTCGKGCRGLVAGLIAQGGLQRGLGSLHPAAWHRAGSSRGAWHPSLAWGWFGGTRRVQGWAHGLPLHCPKPKPAALGHVPAAPCPGPRAAQRARCLLQEGKPVQASSVCPLPSDTGA